MCVVALAWQAHPDWPLVLIGNRDEYHERPAAALSRWEDDSGIIAGRDLQSGGTWIGVADGGRAAVVTNVRNADGPDLSLRTRGELITGALAHGAGWVRSVVPERYNRFNLISLDRGSARFLGNFPQVHDQVLKDGIYGISNGGFDEPWPKVAYLKARMKDWLERGSDTPADFFDVLMDDQSSGRLAGPLALQPGLIDAADTPVFIRNTAYGTRCSTVIAVQRTGDGWIRERRFDSDGAITGETEIPFTWNW